MTVHMTTMEETYQDRQIIFEEGSHGDWIYVIESGSVEILKEVGDQKVVIETLEAGYVFGEIGYIAKKPRTATVRALGETTVGILDRMMLDEEFNKLSGSFQAILRSLALRLERTTQIACEAISRRKEPRISKVLDLHFESEEKLVKAFSENISPGGIFINTEKPLSQDERFMLNFFLPDDPEPLKVECEVSWNRVTTEDPKTHPMGMGVKFIQIGKNDLHKLKEAMAIGDLKYDRE